MNTHIYTWNILTPNIYINKMTWNNIEIAKIDKQRFFYRKKIILNIILKWLKNDKVIICLQEVCKELLEELILLNYPIFYTTCSNYVKNNMIIVTIVKGFTSYSEEIELYDKRTCLKIFIEELNIYNLHMHWKWDKKIIKKVSQKIYESITAEKFLICGDMNKNYNDLQPFIDEFDCIRVNNVNNSNSKYLHTGIYIKTNEKDVIDHIFISSSIQACDKLKIIKKVNKYKIMYNIEKIKKLFQMNKLNYLYWITKRKNKDISDHKPVYLSCII